MKLSQRIKNVKPSATLALTALANKLKAQGVDVIGFGAGEPDFDTPEPIKEAARRAINTGKTKYTPVGGIPELKAAVCEKFKRDNALSYKPAEVTVNCGGKHSFYNLMQSILDEGDEVIVPAPYWVSYPPIIALAGGRPVIVDCPGERGFKMTPEQLSEHVTDNTRAIIINSPSNPTGSAYTRAELAALAGAIAGRDIIIVSDDIYESMLYDARTFCTMANISDELKARTIVLNGVSKAYSMTGWRIGYMAGDAAIIQAVETLQSQSTSNPTSISQWAAVEALTGDQSFIGEMMTAFTRRRSLIVDGLNRAPGISCQPPDGAFYAFPRVSGVFALPGWPAVRERYAGQANSSALCSHLLDEARVAVVPGVEFGNDEYLRLSFATSDENITRGVERICEAMQRLAG
ncbi:MAG TPA: pyridoxal phosphate-dependent aminotransferase [Spirochaetota bacterium]|nr:pyridoxal phosphate-dependent aminotransferase [Spirochaetota bacterium]HNT12699.1 pyridoxal phosphate-dependent aminotransferase [Spirochaetota bacterium]HNV45777.1 pyridoxal phosphate-dependent aminotransferase [Spirochaetota bacterium]HPI23691.1 pyridoxal phosphate-dependent aminotransferase [Spirochaetota bacterium]HPU87333.1 pyridoxal phosphate-dependent aminotransferase [Spirochaetota bacterium]